MHVYREPGAIEASCPNPSATDVIEEAWRVCKERQAARVGKEPSRWRIFARSKWEDRLYKYAFMRPDFFDVLEAQRRLKANPKTVSLIATALLEGRGWR